MSGFVNLGAYGATVSAVMLGTAVAFAVLPKFTGVRWAKALVLPLILSGVAGLASVKVLGFSLAGVTSSGAQKVSEFVGRAAPAFASVVVILIAIGVAVLFGHDTWAAEVKRRGVLCAVATPLTLGFVPGMLGTALVAVAGIFPLVLGGIFAYLLGGW